MGYVEEVVFPVAWWAILNVVDSIDESMIFGTRFIQMS